MATIHVSPTGGGDGSSPESPTGLQEALGKLEGQSLAGAWTVRLAAGVYPGGYRLLGFTSASRVVIEGPDVAGGEPTAVLEGGSTAANGLGLLVSGGKVLVRDIAFRNYNPGKATGVGLQFQDGCDAWTINVHASNCSFVGVYASGLCKLRVTGGTVVGCQRGVRAYNLVSFTVGYNSAGRRLTIRDCTIGFEARDLSAGHLDYTDISGCDIGVWIYQASRVHPMACSITGSKTVAVHASSGGWWYDDKAVPTVYEGNARRVSTGSASSELSWGEYPSTSLVDRATGPFTLTGATREVEIKRLRPLPGDWLAEPGSGITFRVAGRCEGPGAKSLSVHLNYTSTGYAPVEPGPFTATCRVVAVSATEQRVTWETSDGHVSVETMNLKFNPNLSVVAITGVAPDLGDTVTVELADFEYTPGTHSWTT